MEPIVITLDDPVTIAGQTMESLVFKRKMVARDLRGLPVDLTTITIDQALLVAGRLCGQTPAVMGELSFADIIKVNGVVFDFFGVSQAIGD